MHHLPPWFSVLFISMLVSTGVSGDSISVGGDVFVTDSSAALAVDAPRDAFVSGFSSHLSGNVSQDAHATGFKVEVDGRTGGDLYSLAANLTVNGPIGQDFNAAAFSVLLDTDARVGGNVRIAGGTLVLNAPIDGSLVATAGTITLDSTIGGDVQLATAELLFGDKAKIDGTLRYTSPEAIDIPPSVISPERVRYEPWSGSDVFGQMHDTVDEAFPPLWPSLIARLSALLIVLLFLTIVAAVFFAFAPESVERLRQRTCEHAWRALLYGFLGLSTLVGALPVSVITIVGIPLTLIVLLAIVTLWTLGYILGVYVIASRIRESFGGGGEPNSTLSNLAVLTGGFITIAMLNLIPLIGWWINLAVMLLGLGAMTFATMERLVNHTAARN